MKKKVKVLSSVALMIMLVMALAVTAFAASTTVSVSNSSAKPGDTITFTVTPGDYAITANVAVSGPISITSVSGGVGSTTSMAISVNSEPVTYTCKVNDDAKPGETYSLNLSNIQGSNEQMELVTDGAAASASGTIEAVPQPSPSTQPSAQPTTQPSAQPTTPAEPTTPAQPDEPSVQPTDQPAPAAPAADGSGAASTTNTKLDKVPKTADETPSIWAFAVIGIAAASVVTVTAVKKVRAK